MHVTVIGSGYVGISTALMLCELNHVVYCVENDREKLHRLRDGQLPFYEPGMQNVLQHHLQHERLFFFETIAEAIGRSSVLFLTVGTPALADGSTDLRQIEGAAAAIGKKQASPLTVVVKSTVPVGTSERVKAIIEQQHGGRFPVRIAANPEFLREGAAFIDAMYPQRIVIGAENEEVGSFLRDRVYSSMNCPFVITDLRTAEMIKYAANAFLAMKVSFINEIARMCDAMGVNVDDVAYGIGLDQRIGAEFLKAGIGWGGSCFPKDLTSLMHLARRHRVDAPLLCSVKHVNDTQVEYVMQRVESRLGPLEGKTVAVLGLTFKPNTDDLRESPAVKVIHALRKRNCTIRAYDPATRPETWTADLGFFRSPEEAARHSDCLFLLTEWRQCVEADWQKIHRLMRQPVVLDGRNALDVKRLKEIGFEYIGIGRSAPAMQKEETP